MAHIVVGQARRPLTWHRWVRETRSSCRFVWIYVPGMLFRPGRWAPTFRGLSPEAKSHAATVEVQHPGAVYGSGIPGMRRWRAWARSRALDVARITREVQRGQPYPVGMIADDFGVRVLLEMADAPSPVLPAFLILNNPMLGSTARSHPLFEVPGYVRTTKASWADDELDLWGLDFAPIDRMRGEKVANADDRHWEPRAMGSLREAVAACSPARSWA